MEPTAGTRFTRLGDSRRGLLYGLLGMLMFSQTLPMTRLAVTHLDPLLVGLGRVCLAALPALLLLRLFPAPALSGRQWRGIAVVAFGVVLAFPLLSAWGMQELPAAHGAILIALLPLATALAARFRTRERPSALFWLTALAGTLLVAGFALSRGGGALQGGDLLLLAAIVLGGIGYAEGGRIAAEIGGWRVICWALVLGSPVALLMILVAAPLPVEPVPWRAWVSLGYLALFSQLLGFFVWYQGLALGGVARVSQLQLLMPFFTLLGAAALLGEAMEPVDYLLAGAVSVIVLINRKTAVARAAPVAPGQLADGSRLRSLESGEDLRGIEPTPGAERAAS